MISPFNFEAKNGADPIICIYSPISFHSISETKKLCFVLEIQSSSVLLLES